MNKVYKRTCRTFERAVGAKDCGSEECGQQCRKTSSQAQLHYSLARRHWTSCTLSEPQFPHLAAGITKVPVSEDTGEGFDQPHHVMSLCLKKLILSK